MKKIRESKIREFSKRVIIFMTILWFIGAIFGMVVSIIQGYGLEALLNYIELPMSVGVLGYLIKSACENREKIKRRKEEPSEYSYFNNEGENHP